MSLEAQLAPKIETQSQTLERPSVAPELSQTYVGENGNITKIQNEAQRLNTMSAHYVKLGMPDRAIETLFELASFYRHEKMMKEAQAVLMQADNVEKNHGKTGEERNENVRNAMDAYLAQ